MFTRFILMGTVLCSIINSTCLAQSNQNINDFANRIQQRMDQGQGLPNFYPSPLDQYPSNTDANPFSPFPNAPFNNSQIPFNSRRVPPQTGSVAPLSTIEKDFSQRAKQTVLQFGYDIFQGGSPQVAALQGAVAESYILGVGDEIILTLRGQRNTSIRTRVDRDGQVIFFDLKPILAAGRQFGAFRNELENQVRSNFLQTDAFISLGAIREMSVVVGGEVFQPGVHRLNGLATLTGALMAAGGPKKTGSLRSIQVVRGGRNIPIDLYDLLLASSAAGDISLQDGDRIIVPTLQKTIAVIGEVVRPGIYEISGRTLSNQQALNLAGGPLRPEGNLLMRVALDNQGRERLEQINSSGSLSAGEIFMVARSTSARFEWFRIDGHVSVSGIRPLRSIATIRSLLEDPQLVKPDPYMLFAVVQATDPITKAKRFEPVDPSRIINGAVDYKLQNEDVVIFLSKSDIRYLSSADVQAVLKKEKPYYGMSRRDAGAQTESISHFNNNKVDLIEANATEVGWRNSIDLQRNMPPLSQTIEGRDISSNRQVTQPNSQNIDPIQAAKNTDAQQALAVCGGLRVLASIMATGDTQLPTTASIQVQNNAKDLSRPSESIVDVQSCPNIYDRYPELLPFVLQYVVNMDGEINRPGIYPILPGVQVANLINAAGGATRKGDVRKVELSHYESSQTSLRELVDLTLPGQGPAVIGPGDGVRITPASIAREAGTVLVRGEVLQPGSYTIRRGERLSELFSRVGGVTDDAYPLGTVFTRASVREEEQRLFEVTARELESSIASAIGATAAARNSDTTTQMAMITQMRESVRTLTTAKAVGRVVTESDPTVLQLRPELDIILQPGDEIFIPKRPSHVTIVGEVLHSGAQQFKSGTSAADYIRMAGGLRETADEKRVFVILPSGRAQPITTSFWNYSDVQIPPGSTIVIPRDALPFNFWANFRDVTQVLSQVALSAAALAVINR